MFFEFAPKRWSTVLFQKNELFSFEQCLTQNHCDLQHFKGKNVFLEKKVHFLGNKTVDQHLGANSKKHVFCKNLLQISRFF